MAQFRKKTKSSPAPIPPTPEENPSPKPELSPQNPLILPSQSDDSLSLGKIKTGDIVFNLDEITRLAEQVDNEILLEDEARPKFKRKAKAEKADSSSALEAKAPENVPDPEFEVLLMFGTSKGIDVMKDTFNLVEPGQMTRKKIASACARLIARIQPMQPGPLADVVVIAGYLGLWVATGRKEDERSSTGTGRETSQTDTGDNGERKDDVHAPSPTTGVTMFPVRHDGGGTV